MRCPRLSAGRPIPAGSESPRRIRSDVADAPALPSVARSAGHRRGDLAGYGRDCGLHRIACKVRITRGRRWLAMTEHLADDRQAHPALTLPRWRRHAADHVAARRRARPPRGSHAMAFLRSTSAAAGLAPAMTCGLPWIRGKFGQHRQRGRRQVQGLGARSCCRAAAPRRARSRPTPISSPSTSPQPGAGEDQAA